MPDLGCSDPLPTCPSRVLVAGTSGSGKTTLAACIGSALGLPVVETDALRHGPGWTVRPSFASDLASLGASASWVTEYEAALVGRAALVVSLDLPVWLVMSRVVRRTVRRAWSRTELWAGNREPALRTFFVDREHVVRWAWSTRHRNVERMAAVIASHPELPVVRLRSAGEVRRWVAGPLAAAAAASL